MASTDNLKNDLEEIQDARDNIKSALNENGANVGDDIRTFSAGVNAVASVKTVNNVSADNNKNVTITAEDIVIKDSESEFYNNTISSAVNDLVEGMGNLGSSLYSITIAETTTTSGYAKTYTLKVDNEEVGVKINIPKDLVVNKGEVKTVTTADTPYTGAVVGDKYIDLELNDSTQNHIYIPVKDLVDVYTGVDGAKITVSINGTNQISATIKAGTIELTDLVSTLQTKIGEIDNKSTATNLVNGIAAGSLRSINANTSDGSGANHLGANAMAIGNQTKATGICSFACGQSTHALGNYSHAEGYQNNATGNYSHAEGTSNALGNCSHAEGSDSSAEGTASHAEGRNTTASGNYGSHAEGYGTKASSSSQHVQGKYNIDDTASKYAHIVGNGTGSSNRSNAHTIDWNGLGWFAGGLKVGGTGQDDATAKTVATTDQIPTVATNILNGGAAGSLRTINSATEDSSYTIGQNAFAEGIDSQASGYASHSEGDTTTASGTCSHAEGNGTTASAGSSHAEGDLTTASGGSSHAEGSGTTASGTCSHAEGNYTTASGGSQHVQGKYNIEDTNSKYAHIVGNGTGDNNRSNAHTIDWNGNGWFAGDVKVGGTSQDSNNAYTLISSDTLIDYQYRQNGVLNQNDISDYITKKIDSSNTGVAYVEYGGQPRK